MLIISTRKDFTDPDNNNENSSNVTATIVKKVDLQSGKVSAAAISNLNEKLKGKKVLLLIHGYNNSWKKVRKSYHVLNTNFQNILKDSESKYDEVIGFIWPGGDHAWEYPAAKSRAKEHIEPLANFLLDLSDVCTVDVMTHSLGCYLTLSALTFYMPNQNSTILRNLFLTAAAVDNESIEKGEPFYRATQVCKQVFVFHSKHDSVLKTWYPVGDFGDRALGYKGPENISEIIEHSENVFIINCHKVIYGHSDYKHNEQVFSYLFDILTGKKPKQFITLPK